MGEGGNAADADYGRRTDERPSDSGPYDGGFVNGFDE